MKMGRRTWIALIGVLILLVPPFFMQSPAFLQFMILILWYAYLTTSWNLVGGFAGVLPLGHAAFAGIGAYTSSVLFIHYGLTPWVGMFA